MSETKKGQGQKNATTENTSGASETVVNETAATSTTATPVAAVAAETPAVAKTRLFWRKSCDSIKDSTNTEIKEGEVFGVTDSKVLVPNPLVGQEGQPDTIEKTVYSLKRGKRIYYTPYVTPEQETAAMTANEAAVAAKKEAADKKQAEKDAKKAEKAGTGTDGTVAQPAAVATAPVAEAPASETEQA